mmetsp:Transcript_33126/g.130282  ORF Transcript_33126/g.130282 Transcript_33126/m.130282 type:complete len:233 (+) Transcript_33126:10579-11277(+)
MWSPSRRSSCKQRSTNRSARSPVRRSTYVTQQHLASLLAHNSTTTPHVVSFFLVLFKIIPRLLRDLSISSPEKTNTNKSKAHPAQHTSKSPLLPSEAHVLRLVDLCLQDQLRPRQNVFNQLSQNLLPLSLKPNQGHRYNRSLPSHQKKKKPEKDQTSGESDTNFQPMLRRSLAKYWKEDSQDQTTRDPGNLSVRLLLESVPNLFTKSIPSEEQTEAEKRLSISTAFLNETMF